MRYPLPSRVLGDYQGKKYRRYQVVLEQSGLDRNYWHQDAVVPVIAESPIEACHLIKNEFAPLVNHPTEITCAGPKGGTRHLFIGYEGLIWAKMCQETPDYTQMVLAL